MKDRLVVICGAPKAGTTSLYRYLAASDEISPSVVKELGILSSLNMDYSNYVRQFSGSDNFLEATPGYIFSPDEVMANSISIARNVDLIFIVRNPVDLFFSFYRHRRNKTNSFSVDMSFSEFLRKIMSEDDQGFYSREAMIDCKRQLDAGMYGKWLKLYRENARDNINFHIVSFDYMARDPKNLCRDLLVGLGFNAGYIDEFNFEVENKNRVYKSIFLHKLVHVVIMKSEFILNKFPRARSVLRAMYSRLNSSSEEESMGIYEQNILTKYFEADKLDLHFSIEGWNVYGEVF
jgi:hypothetical protein